MKELQNILNVFQQSRGSGQRMAIATVVNTHGSVYRRPGARMLLTETGQMVGAISGGCLESDVFERAQPLMQQNGDAIVVQYDTTASEDLVWGLGLGCNGVVQVLIESLLPAYAISPLAFIADCFQKNQSGAIATIFQVEGRVNVRVADRLLLQADGTVVSDPIDQSLATQLLPDAYQVLAEGRTQVKSYALKSGSVAVLLEAIQPPISLLVFGAGYDAMPVVQLAKQMGWQVTVIDHRPAYATRDRFPQADEILSCRPTELPTQLSLNPQMVAVVMTHHYQQDLQWLKILLPSSLRYLGILGPKRRTQQLLTDLQTEGFHLTDDHLHRLHFPIGLDIGAETPEEIALAIAAEIQAVLANHPGSYLRERQGPIHSATNPCPALA